jgi:hypothetical protein
MKKLMKLLRGGLMTLVFKLLYRERERERVLGLMPRE